MRIAVEDSIYRSVPWMSFGVWYKGYGNRLILLIFLLHIPISNFRSLNYEMIDACL